MNTAHGREEMCTSTLIGDYVLVLVRKDESSFKQTPEHCRVPVSDLSFTEAVSNDS